MRELTEFKALSELENYEVLERPVYVAAAEDMVNKSGKSQISFTVKDGKTTEKVTMFDMSLAGLSEKYPFFKTGEIVVMSVTRKNQYFNAAAELKETREEYNLNAIAQVVTDHPERCVKYILEKVTELGEKRDNGGYDPLYRLVGSIYNEYIEKILRGSSAVALHHSGLGGNVQHTAEVVELCYNLLKTTIGREIDGELLLTGAALHDIGKLVCYETDELGMTTVTPEYIAHGGHHFDSLRIVHEAAQKGNYNPERILILENMIASHHGSRDYGDLAEPMTAEAVWLHLMDDLDAKHALVMGELKNLKPGEFSSRMVYGLDTKIYRRKDQ